MPRAEPALSLAPLPLPAVIGAAITTGITTTTLRLTAGVTGKGGIWREKPPDAESAVGAESPKVWAQARTCPVVMVNEAVAHFTATTEPDVTLLRHPAPQYVGHCHWYLGRATGRDNGCEVRLGCCIGCCFGHGLDGALRYHPLS